MNLLQTKSKQPLLPYNLHSLHVTIHKIVFHSDVDNWLLSSIEHKTKKEGQQNKSTNCQNVIELRLDSSIDAQCECWMWNMIVPNFFLFKSYWNQKWISFKGVQRQNVSNPFNLHSFHVTICKIVFHSDVDNWLLSSMRHRTKKEGQQNKIN